MKHAQRHNYYYLGMCDGFYGVSTGDTVAPIIIVSPSGTLCVENVDLVDVEIIMQEECSNATNGLEITKWTRKRDKDQRLLAYCLVHFSVD